MYTFTASYKIGKLIDDSSKREKKSRWAQPLTWSKLRVQSQVQGIESASTE